MKRNLDHKTVTIYTLAHPDTGYIFYIGQTTMPLKGRLHCHWTTNADIGEKMMAYMKELKTIGKRPVIEPLDTCEYKNKKDLECFWIQTISGWGYNLVNFRHNRNKSFLSAYERKTRRDLRMKVLSEFDAQLIRELYARYDPPKIAATMKCTPERIRQMTYSIMMKGEKKIIAWLHDAIVDFYNKKAETIYNIYLQKLNNGKNNNDQAVC